MWKRMFLHSVILLGRVDRIKWFWRYIILKKPMGLTLSFMAKGTLNYLSNGETSFVEPLFIEGFKIESFPVPETLLVEHTYEDVE